MKTVYLLNGAKWPEAWVFMSSIILIGVLHSEVWAQSSTISGLVRDVETGESLPYANVVVKGTSIGTATNLDGHFVLLDVPGDSVTVQVAFIGYHTLEVGISMSSDLEPLLLAMEPLTTLLDEVLVTAESYQIMKTAEKVSQITVSPRDLAVLPSIGDVDIFRSLQLLPGVSGTNEGSSGLYVRGGTPDQNLVLLDGMTVYHVDHFFGFFSAFNADAVKDVQMYKGGYPAEYGGRTSSVVDLTGKAGNANDFNLGVGVNLLSANVVAEVPLGGKGSILISGRRSYTDVLQTGLYSSIYETLTGDDITPEQAQGGPSGRGGRGGGALGGGFRNAQLAVVQPNFFFYDLNGKVSYRPSSRDNVSISLYNGQDHLDKSRDQSRSLGQGGLSTTQLTNQLMDLTDWGNVGGSAKWSRQWAPRFYSNALISYSQYFSEYDRRTFIERVDTEADTVSFTRNFGTLEDNRVNDFTFRLNNEWQASKAHMIGIGVQATRSDVRYDLVRDDTLSVLDRRQEAFQAAVYLQDSWSPIGRLNVTAGLRGSYYDQTDQVYWEPRLAAIFGITAQISLKAAYGKYNQYVARVVNENITEGARDFWLLADGQDVGVQGATHYVAGASYETQSWLFDAEAYYKDLTGLTEFSLRFQRTRRGVEESQLFFTGDGVAKGVELLIQKKTGKHTGWLSYTLANVEHTFDDLNGGLPFPALHDQLHELKLVNSVAMGRWNLAATWTLATGKPYTSPESTYSVTLLDGLEQSFIHVGDKNRERLPAYHRLDAALHYRFPVRESKVDVGFSVFNLYNHENVWYREFDLTETPMVTTDVTFLGITPNLSLRVDF